MAGHDIIVIGASAGGVTALQALFAGMPSGIAASFFVVQHLSAQARSVLPEIITGAGHYPAEHPRDGAGFLPGRVYVASPDHHLLLEPECVRVLRGPRENGFRPSVDALFRSAACAFGPRVVGVVLTGSLGDGSLGLQAIKQRGGIVLVQDPRDAAFPSMPATALSRTKADGCLALERLPDAIAQAAAQPAQDEKDYFVSPALAMETRIAEQAMGPDELLRGVQSIGRKAVYTCPECNGSMWEIDDGEEGRGGAGLRFRCHVGHAYSAGAFMADQARALESALYSALRIMEEKAAFMRQLGERMRDSGLPAAFERYREKAADLDREIDSVRQLILQGHATRDPLLEEQA